jgi:hypothetical protein
MKPFTALACFLLGFIAVMQLIRLVLGWDIAVNGIHIPLWASGIAAMVTGSVAVLTWRESRR